MDWIQLAMTQPSGGGGGNPLSMFVPIIGMVVIFYFLLIRPQQKRQKETKKMIDAIKKGDRVVTSSGLYGTVAGIKENIVVLKIAENTKVEMLKSSVSGVIEKAGDN